MEDLFEYRFAGCAQLCLYGFNKLCQSVGQALVFSGKISPLGGSLKIFLRQTFGLRPQVCFCKIFWEPSDSSLGKTLSILGNLPRAKFFHTTLRLDPHFVPKCGSSRRGCVVHQYIECWECYCSYSYSYSYVTFLPHPRVRFVCLWDLDLFTFFLIFM